ncbi:hypothetical protein MKX03_020656 [Papaver bracteatum]|nr:hypothetical protein MKX03_020656 [Papaver bracteatum]
MSTCILSKRWKYVSNSIPTLDFRKWQTEKYFSNAKSFKNFLDTVLFLHEKPNIQKFYLDLYEDFDESQVYRWITSIIKLKVKEIYLQMEYSTSTSYIFPLSFFTCDSLTLLDLCFDDDVGKFIIPSTVYFPKLKILRLKSLQFVDDITSARKLFSNCPILEELGLTYCEMFERLCIANPALKHLAITDCELTESTVEISAPNLLTISYEGGPAADFLLSSFPSLVEADVNFDIHELDEDDYLDEGFVKIFEKLSSAKHLKIHADLFLVLREAENLLNDSLTFNNLIHLEVRSLLHRNSFDSSILKVRALSKFLQLLPNLESIFFPGSVEIPCLEDDDCWSLDPKYSPPHLQLIKFEYFQGKPMELNAIKLFLKYFDYLETVTIVASSKLSDDRDKQINVMKQLLMFPKPAKCVVKFVMSSEDT